MTKIELLRQVSDYEVFKRYLGIDFALGEMYKSPLRTEDRPSFNIFRHNKGELIFKDFAGDVGDCIKFVALLKNVNRQEAITIISAEFKLSNNEEKEREPYRPIIEERKKTLIDIREKLYSLSEITYWQQYGITGKTLNRFNVRSLSSFRINNSKWFYSNKNNLVFAYIFENGTKLYKPLDNKGYKWITNCSNTLLQGYEQLPTAGGILIITKSLKDVMVLHELGIAAVAPHGEGMHLLPEIMDNLKKKFLRIVVLYDCDRAGYKASDIICKKYNLSRFFINNNYSIIKHSNNDCKDISDFYQQNGRKETEKLLKRKLSV